MNYCCSHSKHQKIERWLFSFNNRWKYYCILTDFAKIDKIFCPTKNGASSLTRLFLKKGFTLVQWEYHYTKGTTTAAEAVATNRHNWPIASNPTSNWTILFSYCCSLTDRLHHFWWFRDSERSCTLADWDTRQQIKQPLPAPAFACFGLQGHLNESHEVV